MLAGQGTCLFQGRSGGVFRNAQRRHTWKPSMMHRGQNTVRHWCLRSGALSLSLSRVLLSFLDTLKALETWIPLFATEPDSVSGFTSADAAAAQSPPLWDEPRPAPSPVPPHCCWWSTERGDDVWTQDAVITSDTCFQLKMRTNFWEGDGKAKV